MALNHSNIYRPPPERPNKDNDLDYDDDDTRARNKANSLCSVSRNM